MNKLILVRYGQYENGHLTKEGVDTMTLAATRLKEYVSGKQVSYVSAKSDRAYESICVISGIYSSKASVYEELYAAEEDGVLPECEKAARLLKTIGAVCDVVVAVVSREYIETLPSYLLGKKTKTSLERGECLVIDLESKSIVSLKD